MGPFLLVSLGKGRTTPVMYESKESKLNDGKRARQHEVGDRIVQAFAGLDCVQEQIPAGWAIHVKVLWDDKADSPLPAGIMLELKPLDDVPADAVGL